MVDPPGATERQPYPVAGQGVIAPDVFEIGERAAAREIILGMDLEPANRGMCIQDRLMVREAQPDPRSRRDRATLRTAFGGVVQHAPAHRQIGFGLPPWILPQSPAGKRTKDLPSRGAVAWPAQECAPSAQSFFATALMP